MDPQDKPHSKEKKVQGTQLTCCRMVSLFKFIHETTYSCCVDLMSDERFIFLVIYIYIVVVFLLT
jgi:hypothetical protein